MKKFIIMLFVACLFTGLNVMAKEKKTAEQKVEVEVEVTEKQRLIQRNILLAKKRDQYLKGVQAVEIEILQNNAVLKYIKLEELKAVEKGNNEK